MTNIVTVLTNLKGAGFIGMDCETEVKLPRPKNNPYTGRVTKRTTGISAVIYQNKFVNGYENQVRRHLEQAGIDVDFQVGARAWGTKVENTPIVVHKDKAYLEVIVKHVGEVTYQVDGKPVRKTTDSEGREYLVDDDNNVITDLPKRPKATGQGGLPEDQQVIIRTFALDSILELRAYGERFHQLQYAE